MRLVQPAQGAHALQQFVGHAVHHLADLAVHVGVQAAEVGDARRRAHAAEEAVALDQQRARPARAAAAAAVMPAGPPPSTTTSNSPNTGVWRLGSVSVLWGDWGRVGIGAFLSRGPGTKAAGVGRLSRPRAGVPGSGCTRRHR